MIDNNHVYEIMLRRRSIRRFKQTPISLDVLKKFVNAARLAPSAANLQNLEFYIVTNKKICSKVFEALNWAGYIKPKWSPSLNERPVAYIVILVNDIKNPWYLRDSSFAASSIVLCAEDEGISSCILCNIDKEKIRNYLKIPQQIIIDSVIALGYGKEKSIIEDIIDSVKYYRDEKEVLHVPKRKLEDILHINKY